MVGEKGLPCDVADLIGEYVKMSGGAELLDRLQQDQRLLSQPDAKAGLEDMRLLLHFCSVLGITDKVTTGLRMEREGGGREKERGGEGREGGGRKR